MFLLLKIKIYFIPYILYRRWNNHNLRLPHYGRFIILINLIVSQIFLQPLILYCYFGNAYIFNKKFRRIAWYFIFISISRSFCSPSVPVNITRKRNPHRFCSHSGTYRVHLSVWNLSKTYFIHREKYCLSVGFSSMTLLLEDKVLNLAMNNRDAGKKERMYVATRRLIPSQPHYTQ